MAFLLSVAGTKNIKRKDAKNKKGRKELLCCSFYILRVFALRFFLKGSGELVSD